MKTLLQRVLLLSIQRMVFYLSRYVSISIINELIISRPYLLALKRILFTLSIFHSKIHRLFYNFVIITLCSLLKMETSQSRFYIKPFLKRRHQIFHFKICFFIFIFIIPFCLCSAHLHFLLLFHKLPNIIYNYPLNIFYQ
jgi:hypothetical protein